MSDYGLKTKEFHRAVAEGDLIGMVCKDCGYITAPQREMCPECYSSNVEIKEFSGKGTLEAFTVIFVPSVEMAEAGYDKKNPYCSGIVKLEEGPSVAAQILGFDLAKPGEIEIGTELMMEVLERVNGEDSKKVLAFTA